MMLGCSKDLDFFIAGSFAFFLWSPFKQDRDKVVLQCRILHIEDWGTEGTNPTSPAVKTSTTIESLGSKRLMCPVASAGCCPKCVS